MARVPQTGDSVSVLWGPLPPGGTDTCCCGMAFLRVSLVVRLETHKRDGRAEKRLLAPVFLLLHGHCQQRESLTWRRLSVSSGGERTATPRPPPRDDHWCLKTASPFCDLCWRHFVCFVFSFHNFNAVTVFFWLGRRASVSQGSALSQQQKQSSALYFLSYPSLDCLCFLFFIWL